jgi:heme/copper-type cytochrome/quinol oxidase subunit 4
VTFVIVLLGLMLGTWGAGLCGCVLSLTRSYRKARNVIVMGVCFLVVAISVLGSLFVLLDVLEAMNVRHGTLQDNAAMCAYTVGLAAAVVLTIRSELRWRRSIGS